jgi:hypothetical protein
MMVKDRPRLFRGRKVYNQNGANAMAKSHRLAVSLAASALIAGVALPALAAELTTSPPPPASTAAAPTPTPGLNAATPAPTPTANVAAPAPAPKAAMLTPKKPVHYHYRLIRVATADLPQVLPPVAPRFFFPLILGIGF